jgi:hypothetical protein
MAINIFEEHVLTLAETAKILPRRRAGRKVHVSTLYRWTTRGLRGIRLETVQVGGTACTTREALQRFFDCLKCAVHTRPSIQPQPNQKRERAIEQAERLLRDNRF